MTDSKTTEAALSSARAEGWKAGRDAAAKVARGYGVIKFTDRDGIECLRSPTQSEIAIAILALEEPCHE